MAEEQADRVRVSVGLTKNIGNFESLRIDFATEVSVPTYNTRETVREELLEELILTLKAASDYVEDQL
jgi:hypothetical protein